MSSSEIFSDAATAYERAMGRVTRIAVFESEERDRSQDKQQQDELATFIFAARVQKLRSRLHMTQAEFAETYRVPLDRIERWEAGQVSPSSAEVSLISHIERDPEGAKGIVWG